jgi:tetrahydromethanopterin S-methyltransferase subunit D
VPEGARDLLVTHRNLNLSLVGIAGLMSFARARRTEPTPAYLLAGLAGLAVMQVTAYLGGRMVYEHGVGVKPAGGVRDERAPQVGEDDLTEVARTAAGNIDAAAEHTAHSVARGAIAPALHTGAE